MKTGKEYIANATLAKDENKIRKQQSDLSEFCNLLNRLFAEFVKNGYIGLKDITVEMMRAAAKFDAEPIVKAVTDMYAKEASRIKYERAKRDFLKGSSDAEREISAAIEKYKIYYEKSALKFYKPQDGLLWRLKYLTLQNGYISFDGSKLIEDNTYNILSEKQADFLNRAKSLYEQIISFNKECEELSGGTVSCVSYAMATDAIITVNEAGGFIFDASLSSSMDFD